MPFQKEYWERKTLEKRRSPTHPVVKEYVIPKIEEIRKIVPINKETKLLDVGAGNGFFSYYFDGICDTTAIDYSEKMIKLNPIKQKFVMDANHLEFKDDSFDVVFCNNLLHHVEDIKNALNEMKRVSKKYIVIIEPNRNNPLIFLFSMAVKEERKALKFTLPYLEKLIAANGLKIKSSFSFGMITPNKTPKCLLSLLRLYSFKNRLGMFNIVIGEK